MDKNSLTYSCFEGCGNCKVSANYVVNNLVMCENCVNTHTHTHILSRVFYKIYIEYQRVSRTFFHGFSAQPINYMFSQWCSAPPCCGPRSIVSYYGVSSRHSPCLVGNAVFSFQLLTLKTKMSFCEKTADILAILNWNKRVITT